MNRHLRDGELARIVGMGCLSYVVYCDWLPDAPYWVGICRQLRQAQPTCEIHLRLEKRGSLGDPVREAIDEAAPASNLFVNLITSWTWRNEPNLSGEAPTNLTPTAWGTWLTAFLRQAKQSVLPPVYAPPLSPGGRAGTDFINATGAAAKAAGVAGWHIHAYGTPSVPEEVETDIWKARNAWQEGRLVVTEYNFGAGRQYDLNQYIREIPETCKLAALPKYNVGSVNLFIWDWNNPDSALETTVNVLNTAVESALRTMQKDYGTVAPPPPPPPGGSMTEAEYDRIKRDIWARAGVGYNPVGGFTKFWDAEFRAGRYIGEPAEQEHKSENQKYWLQAFAGAYLWSPVANPADVHKGLPPFS